MPSYPFQTTINAANLQLKLLEKTTSVNAVADPSISLLMAAKSFQEMKLQKISNVENYYDLPAPTSALLGQIYYVSSERIFYTINQDGVIFTWKKFAGNSDFLFTWGINTCGVLGDNSLNNRASPGTTSGAGITWSCVSAGRLQTIGLKTDGTIWNWGCNNSGQLGTNNTTVFSSPVTTAGGGTNWSTISAGYGMGSGIKTDGTLWTWGQNQFGSLASNSTTSRSSPGTVAGNTCDWSKVSNGYRFGLAIKTDGSLWSWGYGCYGRLGNNSVACTSSPGTVAGGGTTWCQMGAGMIHSAAVKTDGTLWTWGCGSLGSLGNNSTANTSSPVTVAGGGTTWCQAVAGCQTTLGIKTDGTLWTWGTNCCGVLGTNSTTSRCSPGTVSGGGTTWCCVSTGKSTIHFSGAVKTDGTLWVWGRNSFAQLGDNTSIDRSSPVTTVAGGTCWWQISLNSCGIAAILK
jgi:alpha-tubulin suppressor-like RCC1 family protein